MQNSKTLQECFKPGDLVVFREVFDGVADVDYVIHHAGDKPDRFEIEEASEPTWLVIHVETDHARGQINVLAFGRTLREFPAYSLEAWAEIERKEEEEWKEFEERLGVPPHLSFFAPEADY